MYIDNPLRLLQKMLEEYFDVIAAESGPNALKIIKNQKVSLIILDYNMPEMNGMETLAAIRADASISKIPVIMCTSVAEKGQVMEAIKAGASNYLVKPFQPDDLKAKIEAEKTRKEAATRAPITGGSTEARYSLSQRQASKVVSPPSLSALQQLHWDKVGIIRSKEGLTQAADTLAAWQKSLPQPTDRHSYELNNLVLTGRLVTEAALLREESRGAHFRSDFPQSLSQWQRHIVFTSK